MKTLSQETLCERIAPYTLPVICKCGQENPTPELRGSNINAIGAYCKKCHGFIKWLRLKSKFSSGGFTKTILKWLPRLSDRHLGRIREAIGDLREGKVQGIR